MRDRQRIRLELSKEEKTHRRKIQKLKQSKVKRAEQTGQQEWKWRALVENAPNYIMMVDAGGTIQFINRTVEGFPIEKTVGKKIYDFLKPKYHNIAKDALKKVFKTGESGKFEAEVTIPGGNSYWFETHTGPIRQDGKITAATLIITDITEHKEAKEQLKESKERFISIFINFSYYVQDKANTRGFYS